MKHNQCPTCKNIGLYLVQLDSFLCPSCDIWLETKCEDINCPFCSIRPEKPSDFYLRKPRQYKSKEMIGDLYKLEDFLCMVSSGTIIPDDGCVGAIWIDSVEQVKIYLEGWSNLIDLIPKLLIKPVDLYNLQKLYEGKLIEIEWCNK